MAERRYRKPEVRISSIRSSPKLEVTMTAKDIREKYNRIHDLPAGPEREKMLLAVLGDILLWIEEREPVAGRVTAGSIGPY